jgi:D-alanyl-D-alanine carboxypeptidase (penicillin-binding protein 5/6)
MSSPKPFESPSSKRVRLARSGVIALLGTLALGLAAMPAGAATSSKHTPHNDAPTPSPSSSLPALQNPTDDPIGGPQMNGRGLIEDPAGGPVPAFDGISFVVADATTGNILAAKNPHGPARPASTQKTLLALTMLPRLDPNSTYTADKQDVSVEGTRVGMASGETYKVDDLWYALLLRSANDAAMGLAKAGAGGDLAKAIRMEQAEAKRLQALDTTVVNPSGLDEPGQFSSAYDLALFGRAMVQRGDARKYMGTAHWLFPGDHTATKQAVDPAVLQVNTINRLLGHYPGLIGVKPGYTTLAHNTDIVAAQRDGKTILVSLMGVPDRGITAQAAAFLDWGFAHDGNVNPVGKLVDPVTPNLISDEDGGYATTSAAEYVAPKPAAASTTTTPIAMRWSTVSGGVAAALFVLAAVVRIVGRRRYRRRVARA